MIRTMLLTALSAAALVAMAAPAGAAEATVTGTVSVQYHCVEPPFPDRESVTTVTFEAPHVVHVGTITVHASFVASFPAPVDIPADGIRGTVGVTVGGSGSGSYTAAGLTSGAPIATNSPIVLSGGKAEIPAPTPGVYTFTPGTIETNNWMGQHLVCTTTEDVPPVAASTRVITG
jgi:hypothetical protein